MISRVVLGPPDAREFPLSDSADPRAVRSRVRDLHEAREAQVVCTRSALVLREVVWGWHERGDDDWARRVVLRGASGKEVVLADAFEPAWLAHFAVEDLYLRGEFDDYLSGDAGEMGVAAAGPADALGDRCKELERAAESRAMRGLPLLARLDGRAFRSLTRGLARPFDPRICRAMVETARFLVQETSARVAYTQSDEITLAWYDPPGSPCGYLFDGRFQKLSSVLAGQASSYFCRIALRELPDRESAIPHFDCRTWQVPDLSSAAEVFLWREDDAVKNSITMAALSHYSHEEVEGRDSSEKQEMLWRSGVNWNDFPAHFRRGTYLGRRPVSVAIPPEVAERVPERHRPAPGAAAVRHRVVELELPPARRIGNLTAVLFEGADPVPRSDEAPAPSGGPGPPE